MNAHRGGAALIAINATNGKEVAGEVVVATRFPARLIGWIGRETPAADEALLLKGCRAVHTLFMKFPIDLLFLDRCSTVIAVKCDLQPYRISRNLKAAAVLELSAGKVRQSGTVPGDGIRFY